jgi:hypothetical protein
MANKSSKTKVKVQTSIKDAFLKIKENYTNQMNMKQIGDNWYGMDNAELCSDKALNYFILDTILENR